MRTKILLSLFALSIGQCVYTQCNSDGSYSSLKIMITQVTKYGVESEPQDPEQYLLLTETPEKAELENVWPGSPSKSFGKISDCDSWYNEENGYANLSFKWHYENSYDEKKGIALVQIDFNVYKDLGYVLANVTIIGEKNDFLLNYKGYLEK